MQRESSAELEQGHFKAAWLLLESNNDDELVSAVKELSEQPKRGEKFEEGFEPFFDTKDKPSLNEYGVKVLAALRYHKLRTGSELEEQRSYGVPASVIQSYQDNYNTPKDSLRGTVHIADHIKDLDVDSITASDLSEKISRQDKMAWITPQIAGYSFPKLISACFRQDHESNIDDYREGHRNYSYDVSKIQKEFEAELDQISRGVLPEGSSLKEWRNEPGAHLSESPEITRSRRQVNEVLAEQAFRTMERGEVSFEDGKRYALVEVNLDGNSATLTGNSKPIMVQGNPEGLKEYDLALVQCRNYNDEAAFASVDADNVIPVSADETYEDLEVR